jgi:ketosteroid isomerase-like protein
VATPAQQTAALIKIVAPSAQVAAASDLPQCSGIIGRGRPEADMAAEHLIGRVKEFLAAIAAGTPVEVVAGFYAPDVVQEEFPNRLVPNGAKRDLAALRAAHDRGRQVISAQSFEVVNAVATGNCVAIEAIWTGTLAIGLGSLKPGDKMRARFAQFVEFKDGLIVRQRNYDCFEPW